ncbi:MAG: lytic transglycosylase domain-containing protein [Aquificae bacterium]|nr:lytic transglycosylase domain-containing protein [Aquificota bacterium]
MFALPALLILLLACTPKTEELVLKKRPVLVLKEGRFYLTERELGRVRAYARALKIKVPEREEVERALRFYLSRKKQLELALSRMKRYEELIVPVLRRYGLPEELKYLPVVESMYDPFAVSRSGAAGLWQLMPFTARRFGLRVDRTVDERFDPYRSTEAAARYLKYLYEKFKNWELVLAAYNCGEGCVERRARNGFWSSRHRLPAETQNYVPAFMAVLLVATEPERYGLKVSGKTERIRALKFDFPVTVSFVVRALDLNESAFRDLNPHIRSELIPPGTQIYLSEEAAFPP